MSVVKEACVSAEIKMVVNRLKNAECQPYEIEYARKNHDMSILNQ